MRTLLLVAALSAQEGEQPGSLGDAKAPGSVAAPQESLARAEQLRRAGRNEEALTLCEEAAEAARDAGSLAGEAAALRQAGLAARSLRGGLERAIASWTRAAELYAEVDDPPNLALVLFYTGNAHGESGHYRQALEALETARERFHALGDRSREVWALSSIGTLHVRRGRFADANVVHEAALDLVPESDLATRGGLLANLADARGQLGDVEGSRELARSALELLQRTQDRLGIAIALGQLGLADERAGAFEEGIQHLEQSLALLRELGLDELATVAIDNLALLEMQAGRLGPALEHQREGLRMALERADPWLEANAHFHLSRILQRLDRLDEARASDERVAELGERLESPLLLMRAHLNAARRLLAGGAFAEALDEARTSIRHARDVVSGLAPEEDARARDHCREAHDIGVRCALALASPAAVLEMIERGRAQALVASLGGRASVEELLSPALRAEGETAREAEGAALRRWRAALEAAGKDGDDGGAVAQAHAELESARKATRAIEQRILVDPGGGEGLAFPEPVSLAGLQASLGPDEAFVLYLLVEQHAAALLVTRDAARLADLGPTAEIEGRCSRLCSSSTGTRGVAATADSDAGSPLEHASELRRLLLAPLGLSPNVRRLLVSPDGVLAYAPFGLIAPELEVAYLPSATTLAVLRARPPGAGVEVLALGDPRYSPESGLAELPGSRAEAELGDVRLLGADASEDSLLAALSRERPWRAVHLACHARVSPDAPLSSELCLSPSARSDGRLSVLEVFGLPLRTDLVVLSACETGVGKLYRSEGVFGFTRAFLKAGASRVIVSLWRVDDGATRALMQRLYELWSPRQGQGLPLATALQRACDHVRSQAAWSGPEYWAAWQLWGLPE